MKEFSELLSSSFEEASLLLDLFTRDATRVFNPALEKKEGNESVSDPQIRIKLLGSLLNTEDEAVGEIAKGWLAQENLIRQGRKGITTLFQQLRVPASLKELISHFRNSDFKTRKEEDTQFRSWIG